MVHCTLMYCMFIIISQAWVDSYVWVACVFVYHVDMENSYTQHRTAAQSMGSVPVCKPWGGTTGPHWCSEDLGSWLEGQLWLMTQRSQMVTFRRFYTFLVSHCQFKFLKRLNISPKQSSPASLRDSSVMLHTSVVCLTFL